MKFILIACSIFFFAVSASGQKKHLDYSTPGNWPIIESPSISNDGKFVDYFIRVPTKGRTFVAQAIDSSWKVELTGVSRSSFTHDGHKIIFLNHGDSLGIWELGTTNIRYISHVVSFNLPGDGDVGYLVYQKESSGDSLVLFNFVTGEESRYAGIKSFIWSAHGKALIMMLQSGNNNSCKINLLWLDLSSHLAKTLCQSCEVGPLTLDAEETGLSFLTSDTLNGHSAPFLYYYKEGMDSATILADSVSEGMEGMSIVFNEGIFFNRDGDHIFFKIEHLNGARKRFVYSDIAARVRIRGPRDYELEFAQAKGPFLATINLNDATHRVIRLQQEADKGRICLVDEKGDWIVTQSNNITGDPPPDPRLNMSARPDVYLVSTKDGVRRLIEKRLVSDNMLASPSGKYFIWFDQAQKQWFSYNTVLKRTAIITKGIILPVYYESDYPDFPGSYNIGGWLEDDKGALVYDRFDIWIVDLDGIKPPVNLTNGYGARNKIRFRCVSFRNDLPVYSGHEGVLLSAFDLGSKKNGFFRLDLFNKLLQKLMMAPQIISTQGSGDFCGFLPGVMLKAKNADVYFVTRMSATEYPNLFITKDFRKFKALTDLAPQKEYNWYTTELIHWKLPDGRPGEGILFKPENFNPQKKYPIIYFYYEKTASFLNIFIHPALSIGGLDIPWFVSNGYLVFVPDIYYKIGYPGRSACNSVVSAALFLSKKTWVDALHMGLQGHSYGGYETNYIVSHSALFKAAAPASGVSNTLSDYGESGRASYYEHGQGRIGTTLWKRPDLFFENSPIINADKVTASVLIMHTTNDNGVLYSQGLQWYNVLHKLGKKVWLLTYDGEDHTLSKESDCLDYSIRLAQFFDHCLKGRPIPRWMANGNILAKSQAGFELDITGEHP